MKIWKSCSLNSIQITNNDFSIKAVSTLLRFKLGQPLVLPLPSGPAPSDLPVAVEGLGQPDYTQQEVRDGRGHPVQTLTQTSAAHDKVVRHERQQKQHHTRLLPKWQRLWRTSNEVGFLRMAAALVMVVTLSARCSVPWLLRWLLFLELEGWPKKRKRKSWKVSHLNQNKGVFLQLCAVN